jgi:hypothetical protein
MLEIFAIRGEIACVPAPEAMGDGLPQTSPDRTRRRYGVGLSPLRTVM